MQRGTRRGLTLLVTVLGVLCAVATVVTVLTTGASLVLSALLMVIGLSTGVLGVSNLRDLQRRT